MSASYFDAIRALNAAAYAAMLAGRDTKALPHIDRQALQQIARETDRLVDQGETSGKPRSNSAPHYSPLASVDSAGGSSSRPPAHFSSEGGPGK